jgi:hypothetical protein
MNIIGLNGNIADVNELHQILTRTVVEHRPAYISRSLGKAFIATADDAAPTAAEYTIWLKNNSDVPIVINSIFTFNVAADVVWKLHSVTGTGGTAAAITPVNLNLSSGLDANVSCNGGAGGVSGLTSSGTITAWAGGVTYFNTVVNWWLDALILGKNDAIAVEFDAGTGSRAGVSIMFHDAI